MEFIWCRQGDEAMEDVLKLRRQVLCDEIGFSDSYRLDDDDKDALHLLCRQDGQAVCTARIVRYMAFRQAVRPCPAKGKGPRRGGRQTGGGKVPAAGRQKSYRKSKI